jgi:DNA-binding NtrC family response regulator
VHAAIPVLDPTVGGVPDVVKRVARGAVNVHITGETGSGKEVLARTLHALSGRAGEFVAVNCATLGENLLESELFGHERGAFSGAAAAKPGLLEIAAGGTVLLDEIGDLPPGLQGKLLRALETRQVYRVGGVKPVTLDALFVSATHRDIVAEVTAGRFRRDLYYRVNGITLVVAPLRHRLDAIPALAEELVRAAATASGRPALPIAAAARAALMRHDWPGNVRELRTVIERALLVATGDEIRAADLLFDRLQAPADDGPDEARARLTAAAIAHRGNITSMAQSLGTSRSQVRRLLAKHGIELERYRDE